jgi:hypothetical protein
MIDDRDVNNSNNEDKRDFNHSSGNKYNGLNDDDNKPDIDNNDGDIESELSETTMMRYIHTLMSLLPWILYISVVTCGHLFYYWLCLLYIYSPSSPIHSYDRQYYLITVSIDVTVIICGYLLFLASNPLAHAHHL